MKIDQIKIGAVIPTQQYGNIQPEIILSDVKADEGTEFGMKFVSELFAKYSEKGGLIPKEVILATGSKKSFNEEGVEVQFEPIAHTYQYKDKPLTGATDYIKRFFKPFDAETMAEVSANSWGVDAKQVKELWESNGKLTALFGTVVHNALEFYNIHNSMGQVISDKKKLEDNYAMPKHPILRAIIQGFEKVDTFKPENIYSEVLITDVEGGTCGHADRVVVIDKKKKICRIGDFKVNINSEEIDKNSKVLAPFNDLPANKLSKYQLQMSVYANMLQKSGWTVEGLDVYVYEDEWKHFELPVLQVLN